MASTQPQVSWTGWLGTHTLHPGPPSALGSLLLTVASCASVDVLISVFFPELRPPELRLCLSLLWPHTCLESHQHVLGAR